MTTEIVELDELRKAAEQLTAQQAEVVRAGLRAILQRLQADAELGRFPEDDEPLADEDREAIIAARAEIARGEIIGDEELTLGPHR
jgi:hypothetical protein